MSIRGEHPVEQSFGIDELFFSTTDLKGFIRSGNEVFVRVSGYPDEELVGRPHNIVRHPDMPRALFRLLWDHLAASKIVAAYVKNRAKDGSYYWVFATVVPAPGGYLSIRLKPTSSVFPAVERLYREVRAVEVAAEAAGKSRSDVIEQSAPLLLEGIQAAGHSGYNQFMRAAMQHEQESRIQQLASRPAGDPQRSVRSPLDAWLQDRSLDLAHFAVADAEMHRHLGFLTGLAGDIRQFALNASLAANRLGADGEPLRVVAGGLQAECDIAAAATAELVGTIERELDLVDDLRFRLAVAMLESEVAAACEREPAAASLMGTEAITALRTCLTDGIVSAHASFEAAAASLAGTEAALQELRKRLATLGHYLTVGRVEAAHVSSSEGEIEHLFERVAELLASALSVLDTLNAAARSTRRARQATSPLIVASL